MAHYAPKGNTPIAAVVAQWVLLAAAPPAATADLDGDGRADVFVVAGGKAYRYEATGKPGGLTFIPEALGGKVTAVAVGNLDNEPDGRGDLIVGRRAAGAKLGTIWWEPPRFGGNSLLMVTCRFAANVQPNGIAIGTSSDGPSSLHLARSGNLSVYVCGSDNEFESSQHRVMSGVQCLAAGELNHNGKHDLLVATSSQLRWYQAEEGGLIRKQAFPMPGVRALAIGNLDGDAQPDLVAVVSVDGTNVLRWFEASGRDTLVMAESDLDLKGNSGFTSAAIGDIDGDGRGELLATQSSGPVRWFVCGGDNAIAEIPVPPFGENGNGIALASSAPMATWSQQADRGCRPCVGEVREAKVGERTKKIAVVDARVVTTSEEDLNFPQLRISQAGAYAMGYATGNHGATGWHRMTSTDRGKSWQRRSELDPPDLLATLEIGDGRTVSMGYTTRDTADPRVKTVTVRHSWQNWRTTKKYPSVVHFPFDIERFAFVRSMVRSSDGTKIYAAGHRAARGGGAMLLESADLGLTWRHRSTIVPKSEPWMGRAGPSETALVRLTNGSLLAVMRTGATSAPIADPPAKCPMAYAVSPDDGATWSPPRSMRCPGVLPDMARLPDGTVVLLSGRPGVYVRLATPDGMTWSEPVYLFGGAGCANSAMQVDLDGTLVVVYTESDFCGHEYPGATNYIKMLKLRVTGPTR